MGRRRKRFWYLRLNQKSTRSISALFILLFGFLTAFSYLGQAAFPNSLQHFLNEVFGVGAVFVPVLLILLGLNLTRLNWEVTQSRVWVGATLWVVSLLGLIEVLGSGQGKGGWLGDFLARVGVGVFSAWGAFLVFLTLLVVSLLVIFNTSLSEGLDFLLNLLAPARNFFKEKVLTPVRIFLEKRQLARQKAATADSAVEELVVSAPATPQSASRAEPEIEVLTEETGSQAFSSTTESQAKLPDAGQAKVSEAAKTEKPFVLPPLSLLSEPEKIVADRGDIEKNARMIEKTLASFGIATKVAEVNLGPSVTQYALDLAEGTKIAKVTSLHNDLALALAAPTGMVRIEAPIPGKSLVGVEVPNYSPTLVTLKSLLTSEPMQAAKGRLTLAIGHNVAGEAVIADLARWPHVLVAGSTGSGKSVLLHSMICSILFRAAPDEVKFILVDPKRVELTQYNGIPHLVTPVIVEAPKVVSAFKWAVAEMERRYKLFAQVKARNLAEFNKVTDTKRLPYIVIIVDELADLMAFAASEAETLITRIAQMSRATGIHMVLSTQRPSVDVITGLIKANIPARIALNVSSGTDSRVIIDSVGAEKLLGRGDMLYLPPDRAKPIRIQGVFVGGEELNKTIAYLQQFKADEVEEAGGVPESVESGTFVSGTEEAVELGEPEDERFLEALEVIVNHDKASASLLQRRLRVGYARAARLLDEMQERGLIAPKHGSSPREVYTGKVSKYLLELQTRQRKSSPTFEL